jgi:hypothetical protein
MTSEALINGCSFQNIGNKLILIALDDTRYNQQEVPSRCRSDHATEYRQRLAAIVFAEPGEHVILFLSFSFAMMIEPAAGAILHRIADKDGKEE